MQAALKEDEGQGHAHEDAERLRAQHAQELADLKCAAATAAAAAVMAPAAALWARWTRAPCATRWLT
jgi:hypothetical protein